MTKTSRCALHFRARAGHMNNTNAHTTLQNPHSIAGVRSLQYPEAKMTTVTNDTFDPFQLPTVVQFQQICLPCKMTSKTMSQFDPRLPTFQQPPESATLATVTQKQCSSPQNVAGVPHLPHDMDKAKKTSTAR